MIILGSTHISHESIAIISCIDDISNTKANQLLAFKYDINILEYCAKNALSSIVVIKDIKEAVFCNSLNSSYIVCKADISKDIQDIAENYMFDPKVLEIINNDEQINKIAPKGIDGVIYDKLLKGILWEQ